MTEPAGRPDFETTRWTVVVAAAGADAPAARAALETLCATYWYPLYAFARRRGSDQHRAADLVQGFFAALLEKRWVGDADRTRGRFRAFLLTAFQRFCAKEYERATAQKRGGGRTVLSLDFGEGESRFLAEGPADLEPERAFERRWALTVLGRALTRTRDEFEATDRSATFASLVPYIGGAGEALPYADLAARIGTTEGAVKVAVHRLRMRYREHLRAEIRDTVSDDGAVDAEIRHLLEAVRS